MITYANDILRAEIMRMWKVCFGDSDEFMEMYFRTKYRSENTLVKFVNGKAIASLQMLPIELTFGKGRIPAAYYCGGCTLPEERKKGHMEEIFKVSFSEMKKRDIPVTILIPQNDPLIGYYEKFGYTQMFDTKTASILLPKDKISSDFEVRVADMNDVPAVFEYCNRISNRQDLIVCKTIADFEAVFEDYFLADGDIYMAYAGCLLSGVCFVHEKDNTVFIKNLQADNDGAKEVLLSFCASHNSASQAILITSEGGGGAKPLGMVRITDAEKMLLLYAEKHPALKFTIKVSDGKADWNNNTYKVESGKCVVCNGIKPDFDISINLLTRLLFGYQIDQLPQEYHIFPTAHAVMNLMLE